MSVTEEVENYIRRLMHSCPSHPDVVKFACELNAILGKAPRPEEKPTLDGLEKFMERAGDLHETRVVVTWANLLQWSSSPQKETK